MAKPNINPPQLSEKDVRRFWSRVDKTPGFGPNGDCWRWTGTLPTRGPYGNFMVRGNSQKRKLRAHRVGFLITAGIWSSIDILHSCDNPPCVNPAHLREGTVQDNTTDKVIRGRVKGERNPRAILTEEIVRQIRRMKANGMQARPIAEETGLNLSTVAHIFHRRHWKHI